jgi:hypothetical protein
VLPWCEGGIFHPLVDGVGPRLTRAPFLGWGSGVVVVVGGGVGWGVWTALMTVSCPVNCCAWRIPQISYCVAGNHAH